VKPHNASKAKMEMLILGVGSFVIALALIGLVIALVILYPQVKAGGMSFTSADLSGFMLLVLLLAATMAVFFIVVTLVALRSRKYLLDESPGAVGPNQAACVECNRAFDLQSMIEYNGLHVCARCKPIFLQKLAEGAMITPVPDRKQS